MKEKSKVFIPKKFVKKYKEIFKDKTNIFIDACRRKLSKSLIVNTLKFKEDIKDIKYFKENQIDLKNIPYLKKTYKIKSEVKGLGNTIEQKLGYFQIQEVSSILPAFILDPNKEDFVLDLCAAPGNKTGNLAQIMNNKGLIIANDINKERLNILKYTLKKRGVKNTIITNYDGTKLNLNIKFNKILLDAPCSCEGMVRKKPNLLKNWSQKLTNKKAKLQKKLIQKAFSLLKKNAVLVYSTCTIAPEENEEVIDYLLKKNKNAKLQKIHLNKKYIKYNNALTSYKKKKYNKQLKKAIRIYPHKNDLEAFFICKIKKI